MGTQIKKTALFLWRMVYPLLIYYLTTVICASACSVLLAYYGYLTGNPGAYEEMGNGLTSHLALPITALSALITAIPLGLLYVIFRMEQAEELWAEEAAGISSASERRPVHLRVSAGALLRLIVLGGSVCLAGNSLMMIVPISWDSFQESQVLLYTPSFWMQVLCISLIVPFTEELVFRGLGYVKMRQMLPALPCMLINAAYFGFYHGNLVQGIYAAILGVVITLVMEYYDSLLGVYVVHAAANFVTIVISNTVIGGLMVAFAAVRWGYLFIGGGISVFLLYEIRKERKAYETAFDSNSLL